MNGAGHQTNFSIYICLGLMFVKCQHVFVFWRGTCVVNSRCCCILLLVYHIQAFLLVLLCATTVFGEM